MIPVVFVSHASADVDAVREICDALKQHDVEVWASFKDIEPGAVWDEAIEKAMGAATHVLVMVSPDSVSSTYVRAEVETALNKKKLVIPVLLADVELPLRWHTLQYVKLIERTAWEKTILSLASKLPKTTAKQLRELLTSPRPFKEVKELLQANPQWFGTSHFALSHANLKELQGLSLDGQQSMMLRKREYIQYPRSVEMCRKMLEDADVRLSHGFQEHSYPAACFVLRNALPQLMSSVLFFAIGFMSIIRISLNYACDPYRSPFGRNGKPANDLRDILAEFDKLIGILSTTGDEALRGYRYMVYVNILAGQRKDYDDQVDQRRGEFENEWNRTTSLGRVQVSLVSYTRFLDNIIERPYT